MKPVVQVAGCHRAQQELLDKHAPERLTLANGRTPKVTYDADGPPHIALRIQELYDVTATPRIAMGRVPVLVHILAPSMRPVQITQDLAGFWREHYPRIKSGTAAQVSQARVAVGLREPGIDLSLLPMVKCGKTIPWFQP